MDVVTRLAGINPLLIIAAVTLLYSATLYVAHRLWLAGASLLCLVCLSVLLLPGGRALNERVSQFALVHKLSCSGAALVQGVPWRGAGAVQATKACAVQDNVLPVSAAQVKKQVPTVKASARELQRVFGSKPLS